MKINSQTKSSKKFSGVYLGWWMVLVTGVISGLGHGFYSYGFSVFFKDLAAELGISRALTSAAAGIGRLEGGITAPIVGWLSDRFGPKWVVFTGTILVSSGLVLMYFINSVWSYLVIWGVIVGIGLNIGLTLSIDKAVTDWFIKKRGLAQGIKFGLIGVLSTIVLPITSLLVASYGWRLTCLSFGIFILASSPLLLLFVKRGRPEAYGLFPDGEQPLYQKNNLSGETTQSSNATFVSQQEEEFSLHQALKTSAYWIVCITFGVHTLTLTALNIHLIPMLTDLGIDLTVSGGMMSLMVFCTIPARFFGGYLSDRISRDRMQFLLSLVFIVYAFGIASYLIFDNLVSIYILLVCFGLSSGAGTPLALVLMGRYFGRKSFGVIMGSTMIVRAPMAMLSPIFAGWVYDTTGRYTQALIVFLVLLVSATIALCFAKAPKSPLD